MNGGRISFACRRLWCVRRISDSGRHSDGGQQERPHILKPQADHAACFSPGTRGVSSCYRHGRGDTLRRQG